MNDLDVLSLREKYNDKLITFKELGGVFFVEDIQVIRSISTYVILVEISCIETNSFMKSKKYINSYNIEAYIDVLS